MSRKNILVFGGNGFIGAEVVEYLLDHNNDLNVILVNRGNWSDWDAASRIKPRVARCLVCDRENESLKSQVGEELKGIVFDAVIDFSAYKSKVIKDVFKTIEAERIKQYILISTDSVYEVSQFERGDTTDYDIRETDSTRPSEESERQKLKKFDSYGHHKLKCEEKLLELNRDRFPCTILRLPDVLGARDSTERFWLYQMLIQYVNYLHESSSSSHPEILIPKMYWNKKTSYVYVRDVAVVINKLINSRPKASSTYNLGLEPPLTLIEFVKAVARIVNPAGLDERLRFKCSQGDNDRLAFNFLLEEFPSVTKGPVSIEKAKTELAFKPTELSQALREIVEFYNRAYVEFPNERQRIERGLRKDFLTNETDKELFRNFIQQIIKQ